jgi:hypothetical protein
MWKMMSATLVAGMMAFGGASAQEGRPTVMIDGTSTLRSWSCEAQEAEIALSPPRGFEAGVLAGTKALQTLTVGFPVAGIECGNGTMNEHLRKALQGGPHPMVTYRLSRYEIEGAMAGVAATAVGELTIAGASRPIEMTVTVVEGVDGALVVRGEQELRMTDFGVRPPTLMLGTLRVGDEVRVRFELPLRATASVLAGGTSDRN